MERATEIFAAINFVVIGLSHMLQPRVWVAFFVMLRAQGHAGVFVNGMLSLLVGSIIVAFHNVWSGAAVVLTILGWAHVLKGFLYLTVPGIGLRILARVSPERAFEIVTAGAVTLIIGLLQVYLVLRG